jgi:hypothetical protein
LVGVVEAPILHPHTQAASSAGSRGLDWFEFLLLGVFAVLSMWLVALNLWYAARHGLVWTGIDGEFPVDQLQYLAWIRDASTHVLVSDLFVLQPTPHDYLQPMVALSGGLAALGVAPWLALLLWKPVAVAAVLAVVRAYCRRMLITTWQRRAALALALFAASWGVLGNEWLPFESWGYPFDLVAVAAMIGALLVYGRGDRKRWWAAALGLLASWLHPWQGELLIVILIAAELLVPGTRRRLGLLTVTIAAAAVPLAYYAALDHADVVWRFGHLASTRSWPLPKLVLPLLPLLIAAGPAYLRRPRGFLQTAARAWPLAALAVWGINETSLGAWSIYAWMGITVPLAVLAVEGLAPMLRADRRRLGAVAVALLTIPATVYMSVDAPTHIEPATHNANLIAPAENRALGYLASDTRAGGVLSSWYLGDAVPGETGRRTFVGDRRWERSFSAKQATVWNLLHRWLRPRPARAFVRGTGARLLLADCTTIGNVARLLGPLIRSVHRFGCAAVYDVGS